jgi:hypothetical protein
MTVHVWYRYNTWSGRRAYVELRPRYAGRSVRRHDRELTALRDPHGGSMCNAVVEIHSWLPELKL